MLEKLGNAFKKTVDKVANTLFLDKKLVESIIKDLQRALIEADVNISLVSQLTEKIKKIAYDERIKNIEKKEHLVKALYDELLAIVGKSEEIKIKKQTRIMLLGLYGAGKCVHGESKIQLGNGEIVSAERLYASYKNRLSEVELKDGKIIDISQENLLLPSFNPETCKIENKKATHLWKLNKKDLMEIKIDNGNDYSIKVTPEHPFFALRDGKVIKIRAEEVTENDYISIPREIQISGKQVSLTEEVKKLNLFVYLSGEEIKNSQIFKTSLLKDICKNLKFKHNYCCFTSNIKNGKVPIELINKIESNFIKVKGYNDHKIIAVPLFLTSEFAEFLGYLMGDGHIGKNYAEISTQDPEIIARVCELSKLLFNINATVNKDVRTENLHRICLASNSLVKILKIFDLDSGKKGKELKIPKQILLSSNEVIRKFIGAYFDCDSSASKGKRYIELTSESQILIQQMSMILRRFGILSIISKKNINEIPYWRMSIKARYAEKYADKIGYLVGYKKKIVEEYYKFGTIQGAGNQDMIPLGKVLKEVRSQLGFSIGEIQTNAVFSYGRYEEMGMISRDHLKKLIEYYKNKRYGRFLQIMESINNNEELNKKYSNAVLNGLMPFLKETGIINHRSNKISLTERGQNCLQSISLANIENILIPLKSLSDSDVCWLPVREIKKIENDEDYVYDLTIEDNHSFIANGIVVHNTTTLSKLANYYAKRGHKTCMVGLDVHRPAAPEQLEQLGKQINIPVFIDKKEKSALKIWEKFEEELRDYDLVLIDTAGRHSLDKELIDEIKELNSKIKPGYLILIMQADIGQAAKKQASEFQKACKISGVIITRMDSTAKAGGALSACSETKTPVFFLGTGERAQDIETFDPEAFISRLLGMGDLKTLLDKVNSAIDEKQSKRLKERLEEGKFTLKDLQEQLGAMQNLGPLNKIAELIPGFSKAKIPENLLSSQEDKLKKWKHAINSMTPEEIENPEIMEKETSRLGRIAKGSGTNTSDIRALIKQYKLLTEFMKTGEKLDVESGQLSQKQMMKLAKKFGGRKRL
ncbi:hypothetical protein COV15_02045 [Candidatus Woesearchaeota archaeon CG10_big_fil_rev_8_21_14_0_10_34_12]|nr:MAG: hypothetical protein COV15_02045 [Candidatus Woesearchaeota archaeon CG10_big_fil_rev_8_21_14_0_10_34_12]